MATTNTVWVVIACDAVSDRLRSWLDSGHFEEATRYAQILQNFNDKLKSFAQSKGGHLSVALYDRQILEIPSSAADELPYFLEGFREDLGQNKIAVGIGLDFSEATRACRHSRGTGEIELYTPGETPIMKSNEDQYDEPHRGIEEDLSIPPNIFDPQLPPRKAEKMTPKERKFVGRPDMQKELQAEGAMLMAIGQQMQPPQPQQAPGQPPGQPQAQPRDLMEALNGGPIPGRQAQPPQPPQQAAPGGEEKPAESPKGESGHS